MKSRYLGVTLCCTALFCGAATVAPGQDNSVPVPLDHDASETPAGTTTIIVPVTQPATHLESMFAQKGAVIVRGYTEAGTIQGEDGAAVRVLAIELTDTAHNTHEYGLALEIHQVVAAQQTRQAVAYIDADEIDALLAAIEYLGKADNTVTSLADFDARYHSRGNFEADSFHSPSAGRMAALKAMQILSPSGQVAWATAYFRLTALADIRQQIQNARQTIEKAKQGNS